jgi:hypothetical protein
MHVPLITLQERLTLMSLFIAVYESFIDYIHESVCNLYKYNGTGVLNSNCNQSKAIQEITAEHRKQKEEAKEMLSKLEDSNDDIDKKVLDRYKTLANYDYVKKTEDGLIYWLSPDYDKLIKQRELKINRNKEKNKYLNALMFFVDREAISQEDFNGFIEVRRIRNRYVHEMSDILYYYFDKDEFDKYFELLIELYRKINSFWSQEFEVSVCILDMPENVDYSSVINTRLYNLLTTIDAMLGTHFISHKKWIEFRAVDDALMLPIKEAPTNE